MDEDKELDVVASPFKRGRPVRYPEIMNIDEAALYLTVSRYFLYMLVKGGFVPYSKIGKRIVFRRQDLYDWIGQNMVQPSHSVLSEVDADDCE